MNETQQKLIGMGFSAVDLGGGDHAMIKDYPSGCSVWVFDSMGGINFETHEGRALVCAHKGGEPIEEEMQTTLQELEAAVEKSSVVAYQAGVADLDADELVYEALNAAALTIQKGLGIRTGDFASLFFSGANSDAISSVLKSYLRSELAFMAPESLENRGIPKPDEKSRPA